VNARRWIVGIAAAATAGAALAMLVGARQHDHADAREQVAMLDRTLLTVAPGPPLDVPALKSADGGTFDASRLRGRWSLVFFGFTSCPEICPTTLATLARFAREPASGIAGGGTQVVFVSVDPEHDDAQRIREYLGSFDPRFVGVTGDNATLARFAAAAGAGFASAAGSMDHSTSVFVVDPQGRLAGVLLHPSDPARIVADLGSLRG
jgi:protein SCO1/2